MVETKRQWPTGIRPHGKGIRIRLWKGTKLIHSETVPGDPYTPGDLAAAVKRRSYLKSRLDLGLPLENDATTSVDQQGFLQAAQEYLNCLEASYGTHMEYERIINRYWLPAFADWPLQDIRTRHIKNVLAHASVTGKTKKNLLIPLRGIFAHFELNPNPAQGIRIKKHQKPPVERFSPKERDRILAHMSGQELVYFTLFFSTGIRPSENIALQWCDYEDGYLHIHKAIVRGQLKDTKTHERRRVYVPAWARPILEQHVTRFKGSWIYMNSVGHYHETKPFNAAWSKALKEAGIPYRKPYTCRHTRAAELLSTGVEPGDAAKQMGHTLEVFYRVYAEFIDAFQNQKDDSRFEGLPVDNSRKFVNP